MIYLFHGEDEFSRKQALAEIKAQLGEEQDLHTTLLDGQDLGLEALIQAGDAWPLFGEKRLVIVRGLGEWLESGKKKSQNEEFMEGLKDYLARMSPTTDLVFMEDSSLEDDNSLRQAVSKIRGAKVQEFNPPRGTRLIKWIVRRVQGQEGSIGDEAAQTLAVFVGDDLRQLHSEIQKLLAYAGRREITAADVHLLVSQAQAADIFALVDALGEGDLETAVLHLQGLLANGQHPLPILAMITRQFRLLLEGKILAVQGRPSSELKIHPYVAKKVEAQATRFTLPQLKEIYHWLLDTDVAIKTGRMEPEPAVELLLVSLTGVKARGD